MKVTRRLEFQQHRNRPNKRPEPGTMLGTQDIPRYTGQRVLKDSDIMVSVAEFVTDATSLLHLLAFGEAEGHIPEHWHLPRLINVADGDNAFEVDQEVINNIEVSRLEIATTTWKDTKPYPSPTKGGLSPEKFPVPINVTFVMLISNISPPPFPLINGSLVKITASTCFGPTATAPTVSAPSIPRSIHFLTMFDACSATRYVGNVS